MKICVLVKQVPNEDAVIRISPDKGSIIEDNITFCTNEPDTYALEEALLIKENNSQCEVVVCTLGKPEATQILKEALAKGADRAMFLNSEQGTSLDPLAQAKVFTQILKKENFDLILSGLQSDDVGYAQTGLLIAELLGMTHASLVVGTDIKENGKIRVKKELEGGWFQWAEMELPSSLSIQSGLNKPRYASLKGIMMSKKKPIDTYDLSGGDISIPESSIQFNDYYTPQKEKETKFLEGDSDTIVGELIKVLQDDVKAI